LDASKKDWVEQQLPLVVASTISQELGLPIAETTIKALAQHIGIRFARDLPTDKLSILTLAVVDLFHRLGEPMPERLEALLDTEEEISQRKRT
jgi:hypothetical protein